jgi:hypothetical protein
VGPRAGLDTEARGKILCPRRGSNPDRPVVQPVVRHYTAWAMYSITENIYCSQLSSVAILLKPEPISYRTIQGKHCVLSLSVLSSCGLPLSPTCLLLTANEARSYFAYTIRADWLEFDSEYGQEFYYTVHYRAHKIPPLDPILSQLNPFPHLASSGSVLILFSVLVSSVQVHRLHPSVKSLYTDSGTNSPNVVVEWLTLLLLIREIPGSNLGPEIAYPDYGFHYFPQSLQANAGVAP